MCNNIRRKSPKYKEIENFKPWEFTNNIAYELTIRTEEYKYIKGHLEAIINVMKKEYKKISEHNVPNIHIELKNLSDSKIELYYKVDLDQTYATYIYATNQRTKSIAALLIRGYKELGLNTLHELDDELIKFVYNTEIVRGNTIGTLIANTKILIDLATKQVDEVSSSLHLNFARPKINFPKTPQAHIPINPNMKKDELIRYVTEVINKNYIEQPKLICEADIFFELLDAKEHEQQKENFKAKKFADLFFIYDYVKCKQKESETYHAIVTLKDEIANLKSKKNNKNSADNIYEYSYTSKELKEQIKMKENELENEEKDYFIKNILKEQYLQRQLGLSDSYLEKGYKLINSLIRNYSTKKLI